MRARNLNDEASAAIVAPHQVSVAVEVVVGSEAEEILAAEEEILVGVEVDLQALDSAVTLVQDQDSVVALAVASAIAAAEAVLLAAALAVRLAIAEAVVMVASTRDVLHPRDKVREMRTATEPIELSVMLMSLAKKSRMLGDRCIGVCCS